MARVDSCTREQGEQLQSTQFDELFKILICEALKDRVAERKAKDFGIVGDILAILDIYI